MLICFHDTGYITFSSGGLPQRLDCPFKAACILNNEMYKIKSPPCTNYDYPTIKYYWWLCFRIFTCNLPWIIYLCALFMCVVDAIVLRCPIINWIMKYNPTFYLISMCISCMFYLHIREFIFLKWHIKLSYKSVDLCTHTHVVIQFSHSFFRMLERKISTYVMGLCGPHKGWSNGRMNKT